jgi:hypothetical protein
MPSLGALETKARDSATSGSAISDGWDAGRSEAEGDCRSLEVLDDLSFTKQGIFFSVPVGFYERISVEFVFCSDGSGALEVPNFVRAEALAFLRINPGFLRKD